MQQLCECACRSSKHRAHAFVFGKAPQSVDIDIVQVWSSEEDGSFEACWTLCVYTHSPIQQACKPEKVDPMAAAPVGGPNDQSN